MHTPPSRDFSAKKDASDPSKSPRVGGGGGGKVHQGCQSALGVVGEERLRWGALSWYPVTWDGGGPATPTYLEVSTPGYTRIGVVS